MKSTLLPALLAASTALVTLSTPAFAQNVIENYEPVTAEMLANPPAEEWLMFRGKYNNQGYSELDMINLTIPTRAPILALSTFYPCRLRQQEGGTSRPQGLEGQPTNFTNGVVGHHRAPYVTVGRIRVCPPLARL